MLDDAHPHRPSTALTAVALTTATVLYSTLFGNALQASLSQVGAELRLLTDSSFGLVMGGTTNPTPDAPYFSAMLDGYLSKLFPQIPTGTTDWHALPTPEQFCPIVCLPPGSVPTPPFPLPPPLEPDNYPPNLTFGSSVTTGAGILNQAIRNNISTLQSNEIAVSGYSQSGAVATVSMNDLLDKASANNGAGTSGWPTLEQLGNLHFELTGDPNNPIGGMLDRFQMPDSVGAFFGPSQMQHVPFLNIPLGISPTPTSGFGESTIITGEYDGWGNFPQDPITGLLGDLNAIIGIATVHPYYPDYSGVLGETGQLASAVTVGQVGTTSFDFIPENLPLLQFLYSTDTTAGQFFGDILSPWLRLVIDWSYGNAGDPGTLLQGVVGQNTAGGAGVDGLFLISPDQPQAGTEAFIDGSPYEASIGVAGGPWAETPYGELWMGPDLTNPGDIAGSGIAGVFEKMDPLQLVAGIQNALIQSLVGPWADVFAGNNPLMSPAEIALVQGITQVLQVVTGYDLVNGLDQLLLGGLKDIGLEGATSDLLDGPLIPGQPLLDVVGGVFDVFNFFGA